MGSEWLHVQLQDVCEITSSKRIFASEYKTEGIPFFRGKEIIEKHKGKSVSTELFIEESRYREIKRKFGTPEKGDILLTSVGTLGIPYLISDEQFYFKDGNLTWFRNFKTTDSQFIYYWLLCHFAQDQIRNKCIGSTQKALTIETLLQFDIQLPSQKEQRAIAATLSCLDDKIELNTRIIANLEAQAQAIFDEWFMGLEVDSPYGTLSDFAFINPPRTLARGQLATYIEMSDLSTSISFPNNWVENTPYNGGMRFLNGDTIIARITPCLENGKTAYISCLADGTVGFGSTEYIVLSAKAGYCNEMLYFLARNIGFRDYAIQNMNGSSGRQRVSAETIGNYEMAIPTVEASKRFEAFAKPIMGTIHNCALQNRKLAVLRDALLPKLMSGEIEVPVEG